MRNENQVIDQIIDFANSRDIIRAVTMNGSRVNPNSPKDFFRDYDVVCFTRDPRAFLEDQSWIPFFGDLVILQQNDFNEHDLDGYIFLMLFADGVRIDLSFDAMPCLAYLGEDSLTAVLLDKDGVIPALPPPSEAGYLTTIPTRKEWNEAVNEVFWCSNNIAKGIWRDELPYVKYMYDSIVRDAVQKVLTWYAGMRGRWKVNSGTYGKWLRRFLPGDIWEAYAATYPGSSYAEIWDALFHMLALTRRVGQELAESLGYDYPLEDDRRTVAYLEHVRSLPQDALSFD
jgi:aminoglycoside 6-adenylyltransferase